jgi:hypothetical protein
MRDFDQRAVFDDALHELDELFAQFVVFVQASQKKLLERYLGALE